MLYASCHTATPTQIVCLTHQHETRSVLYLFWAIKTERCFSPVVEI